jgi:hypothetical protein
VTARKNEENRELWQGHENSRTSSESKSHRGGISGQPPTIEIRRLFAISISLLALYITFFLYYFSSCIC